MLNIPSEIKSLFQRDGIYKNFKVHFPNGEATDFDNEKIQQESVVFTESLCSQQMFKFGLAEASQIELTAIDVPNILGATIDCALEIDCTSLGTAWNDQHPYDPNLPWLTPQGYNDGATFSSGSAPVTVSVGTGETLYILNYSVTFEYHPFHADTATPSNPTTVAGIKSADMLIAPSLAGNADQTTTVTFDEPLLRGTVNLTTGKFEQTQKFLDLSELAWTAVGNNRFAAELPDDATPVLNTQSAGDFGYYCSHYFPVTESAVTSNNYCFCVVFDDMNPFGILYVRNVDYSTANDFTASLQNVKFVYGCTEYSGMTNSAYPPGFYASNTTKYIRGRMATQSGGIMQSANVEYYTALADRRRYFRVPYGRFVVNSCPRNHGQMYLRKITAFSDVKFKVEQYINGQYPTQVVKINPYDWLEAFLGGDIPFATNVYEQSGMGIYWGLCNSSGSHYEIDGLNVTAASGDQTIDFYSSPRGLQRPVGEYALRVHFEPSEMDGYADHFFEKALAKFTNTTYKYQAIGNGNYSVAFANPQIAFAALYGTFKPCYQLIVHYINDNDPDLVFSRVSMPIFIDSDKTYIVDLNKLNEFLYCADVPSGYSIANGSSTPTVSLRIVVPTTWKKVANWVGPSTVSITDWATGVTPFNTKNAVSRSGNVEVYIKKLQGTSTPKCKIYNTLKFNKNGLGTYYTYSNAASPTRMAEAIMELTGQFMKVTRTSELAIYKLSEHQTLIPVPNSDWSEFWWDENPISRIGTVRYTLGEDSASVVLGAWSSIYVMDDNNILQNAYWTLAQTNAAIKGQFKSETAYANYTPVDVKMRGLPYLEAGDRIELTAGDGATVKSYIMTQTISGIQNLQAYITSTSGDPVGIVEEEEE